MIRYTEREWLCCERSNNIDTCTILVFVSKGEEIRRKSLNKSFQTDTIQNHIERKINPKRVEELRDSNSEYELNPSKVGHKVTHQKVG